MSNGGPSRRALLAGAAGALAIRPGFAAGQGTAGPRMAALDWTLAAMAVELAVPPVGVAEQALYGRWVGTPALPPGTVELGLRTQPSLEGLAALGPDLILVNALDAGLRSKLERIAPTFENTIFGPARAPLAGAGALTTALGERLGRANGARRFIATCDAAIAEAATRVPASWRSRPLLPVTVIDARHLIFYGGGSLYGDVLAAMGMRGGWAGATGLWGTTLAGLEAIAAQPAADVLVVDPVPPGAASLLAHDGLLRRVAGARGGRVLRLPAAWPFGGLSAASRFASGLADALAGAVPA